MKYKHVQNKQGQTFTIVGVEDDNVVFKNEKTGEEFELSKSQFGDRYRNGTLKIGNVGDKDDFVEYEIPKTSTAYKMAGLTFAPYGTLSKKDADWRTIGQDVLNFAPGGIANWLIDKFIPNPDTRMRTSFVDGALGTGLGILGYKMLPGAAHRRVPILNVSDTEKLMKKEIAEALTKGEAYGATHPSVPITTQGEQKALNREIANSVYRKNQAFNKKVPTSLKDEFVWNTEKRKTSETINKGSGSRSTVKGNDKDIVRNEINEGSQQGGGTENIHTKIRGQKPSDGNLDDLQLEIQKILDGDKEVANDALDIQKTINTEKNVNKSSQNRGTKDIKTEEHGSSSADMNTERFDTKETYDLTPVLEDAENHTTTNTRDDLKDLYANNSVEAKRMRNAKSLNELDDIVRDVRTDANKVNVDRWEAAMKEWIPAVNKDVDKVAQANNLRRDKLKWLDKIEIAGEKPKLKSNITFTKVPRRGGTAGDYIKSYGESQNWGAKYPAAVGTYVGSRAIPTLRNKDDEMFNAGRPSGDDVFEEIRTSMNKKSSVQSVDPNKREE